MSYRNAGRHRHTKGVVLFTVVAIMLFLFIMVMSTLSVVSSAQTRTYTKFKENQAYFTARSGLETVTTALSNRTYNGSGDRADKTSYNEANNKFYYQFLKMMYPEGTDAAPKRGDAYIDTDTNQTFAQMDANSNIAKINVKFPQPPVGSYTDDQLKYIYGECTVYIQKTGRTKARIISHATLGDSESTIVLYIGPKDEPPDVFENALTTFGGAASDNMAVYGGTSLNINSPAATTIEYKNDATTLQGNQYLNANMKMNGASLFPGENGTYVAGDLEIANSQSKILASDSGSGEVGKLFVAGKFFSNTGPTVGNNTGGKVDVYCDSFEMNNSGITMYGDLYIYGTDEVVLNGTINGNVYNVGGATIRVTNQATITGNLYTKGAVTQQNGLTVGSTYYDSTKQSLEANTFSAPPSGTLSREEAVKKFPTLESVQKTYEPSDGTGGTFSGWGYEKIGEGEEKNATNYTPYDPKNLKTYKEQKNWADWPGITNLDGYENGYYVIDATKDSKNYYISADCGFDNDVEWKKIMVKGDNSVNFYFAKGTYEFRGVTITNKSILDQPNISLTTDGTNNISLNTNMYFWEDSTVKLNNDSLINAYMLGPKSKLTVYTANSTLPNVSTIKYDGVSISNSTVLGMGSLVFNEVECDNAPKFLFVRKPSSGPNSKEPGKIWKDLYYFNR